jgi:hypothetical protein
VQEPVIAGIIRQVNPWKYPMSAISPRLAGTMWRDETTDPAGFLSDVETPRARSRQRA